VIDLLPEVPERVYSVGRLDEESMGLMILTNDGELANRLAHPRYGVEKTYRALVAGTPHREILDRLTQGIWLSEGKVRAKRASFVGSQGEATTLELVLAEGKKREIRRMLAKLGHKVMSLTRTSIGPISLKGLSSGDHRPLSRDEIDRLRQIAAGVQAAKPGSSQHRGSRPNSPARGPRPSSSRPETRIHGKPMPGRPTSSKLMPGKPMPSKLMPGKPTSSKLMPGKPTSSKLMPGKPMPSKLMPGKPMPAKPMPGKPMPSKPMPGKAVQERSTAPRPNVRPGGPLPPPGRKPGPPRTGSDGKPARRVIGLDPRTAVEAGLSLAGRPARRRPAIARRPPRRVFGVKRRGEKEGGDEL
jgi:23S rRNA pseudouridine2605 synthase